jgi:ABC-type sugar transport system substrate-binding protein/tRNA A-37 threonylcarbamoyl transferase component Bud32
VTLTTGEILQGRYRIVSLLGQGGMGAVYRAWDTRLNLPVALKEMTPQPGLDPHTLAQLRQQFQQEAQILARLNHPHLVRVGDFFEERGNAYLVMDFVEGEGLAELIEREGALPEDRVLVWAKQLLDALGYCHAQGVIHRDVKPQNVIIRPDGRAVLVDFGLVKLWDPHDPRTRTAMRGVGTPEYAPPEQYDAEIGHTDARSDIYSLGATLYHALTGQAPPTATQRIASRSAFKPPRSLNKRISPAVEEVVLRAMGLAVEDRFPTAQEMAAALGGEAPVLGRPTPPKRQRTKVLPGMRSAALTYRRKLPVWAWVWGTVGVGGLVLAVLVGLGVVLGPRLLGTGVAPTGVPTAISTPILPTETPMGTRSPTAMAPLLPPPDTATPEVVYATTEVPTAGSTSVKTYSDLVVGFAQVGAESEWRVAMSDSIKETAYELGVELKFSDGQQKQENQIKALRTFIAEGVDVIGIVPVVETGWGTVFQEAKDAGIPIILVDRHPDVPEELYVTYLGPDFVEEGRKAGREMAKLLPEGGNVVELAGTVGSAPANDRAKGFREAIEEYPDIVILDSQSGDFTRALGKEVMETFLQQYGGEIDGVYAHNDDMAIGAIQAIKEYGLRPGVDIKTVSIDGIRSAFDAMARGELNCTIELSPLLGPQFYELALKVVNGEDVPKWVESDEDVFCGVDVALEELPSRRY